MRAREINDYYNPLGEGLGRIVPPQVTSISREPVSIALEEIAAGLSEVSSCGFSKPSGARGRRSSYSFVKPAGPCPSMPVQTTAAEPNVHRSEHTCSSATTLRALGGTCAGLAPASAASSRRRCRSGRSDTGRWALFVAFWRSPRIFFGVRLERYRAWLSAA